MSTPIICLGQQPCGFFPRRFFYAKIVTARKLRAEIGGEIVYFCHDSDHDCRETTTILHFRHNGAESRQNFVFANKIQRKWSPLYLKRVLPEWHATTARQLPACVDRALAEHFSKVTATNVADFCLEMYRRLGLLEGVRVVRSSDPAVRQAACAIDDFFVDVPYEGEIVRARCQEGALRLHEGGDSFVTLPACAYGKEHISPTRDTRLRWMQSVIGCTHYVSGAGEQDYLHLEDAPEVNFVKRDVIERSDEAWTGEAT